MVGEGALFNFLSLPSGKNGRSTVIKNRVARQACAVIKCTSKHGCPVLTIFAPSKPGPNETTYSVVENSLHCKIHRVGRADFARVFHCCLHPWTQRHGAHSLEVYYFYNTLDFSKICDYWYWILNTLACYSLFSTFNLIFSTCFLVNAARGQKCVKVI